MKQFTQLTQRIGPALLAAFVLVLLRSTGLAQTIDLFLYDLVTSQRSAESGEKTPITLIQIQEHDIKKYGWPIEDGLFCQAIDTLNTHGARAIGFDIYRDKGVGPNQQCLRDRFSKQPRLISIFNAAADIGAVPGTPAHRQSYNDLSLDGDGILRRDLVHVGGQDEATVSFPMRVIEVATGSTRIREDLEQGRHRDAWVTANGGGYHGAVDAGFGWQRLLLFREPGSYASFSLNQLLSGDIPDEAIKNQIVLIGSAAPSLRDLFEVPHSRFRHGAEPFQISGVEIHANRIATLLDHHNNTLNIGWIMPGWGNVLLVLICASVGLICGEAIPSLRRSVFIVSLLTLALSGGLLVLLLNHRWVGMALPITGLLSMGGSAWIRRGVLNQHHTQQIRRLLGQTTSPAVAQQLWNQRESLLSNGRFEGQLLPVTVLFTDTASFTSVSEQLSPSELMNWLNQGMAICIPAVTRRGGMVNKFTGDGMLAVFGVPLKQNPRDDARAAIEAAIEINTGLQDLNATFQLNGAPAMRMRVGIHSGEVLVGSMGSSERIEYAVIGDTVNCASRLESINKQRHHGVVRVLFSKDTQDLLEPDFLKNLDLTAWGSVPIKGRDQGLDVSELNLDNPPADVSAIGP